MTQVNDYRILVTHTDHNGRTTFDLWTYASKKEADADIHGQHALDFQGNVSSDTAANEVR